MISQTSISALRALQYVARNGESRTVSVREVATQLGESPSYTAKITRQLVKAGILKADRGAQGGIYLSRAPEGITLLQIVRACQGEIAGDFCQTDCSPQATCSFHQAAAELQSATMDVLQRWTLDRLMARPFIATPARDLPCVMSGGWQSRRQPAKGEASL